MKLFFSYGHDKNEEIVVRLKNDLEKRGHTVWIDQQKIKGGNDWRREITTGILQSEFLMSFASNHSIRKPGVCLDELMIAVSVKGAQIQTVLLETNIVPPNNIGYRQYIDMANWQNKKDEGNFESWYKEKLEEIISVVESPETAKFAEEIEYLRKILQPNLLTAKQDRLQEEYFCGREWLSEKVNDWLINEKDSKVLLIDGSPGIGKSAFMAHQFLFNENVGSILFCEWDNPESNNLNAISRSIIFQLASKLSDYRKQVIDLLKIHEIKISSGALEDNEWMFRFLLLKQLQTLIDGEHPTLLILVDGIDEIMQENDGSRRKNALAELLQKESPNFPRWIRFVVTSRNDVKVTKALHNNVHVIHMDNASNENKLDVSEYLMHELEEVLNKSEIDKIATKSDGNFLFAKMASEAIKADRLSVEDLVKGETGDLGFIYLQNFDRIFPSIEDYENFYPAIAALTVTKQRIPEKTFKEITGWNNREMAKNLKSISSFLSLDSKNLGWYHKSVQDWLLSDEADDYMVDLDDGNEFIGEGCLGAYDHDMLSMNTYEILYLLPYLQEHKHTRLPDILSNTSYADLLFEKAKNEKTNFKYEIAITIAEMTLQIYKHTMQHEDIAKASLFLAECADLMVNLEISSTYCHSALRYTNSPTLSGDICMRLAYVYFRDGKWELAIQEYENAQSFYTNDNTEPAQTELKIIEAMMMEANTYRNATSYNEAKKIFEQIFKLPSYSNLHESDPVLQANIFLNYGWTLQENGEYKQAEIYLQQCEKMLDNSKTPISIPVKDIAQIYYIRAVEFYSQADYHLARSYCEKSLFYVKQAYGENAVEICSALNELSAIELRLENYTDAIFYAKKSYDIRLNYYGKTNLFTTISLRNYAMALFKRGKENDFPIIRDMLENVKSIRQNIVKPTEGKGWLAQIFFDLAVYYEQANNLSAAKENIFKAQEIFESSENTRNICNCQILLGKIKYKENDIEGAKKAFYEADKLSIDCYTNRNHPNIIELEHWMEKLHKYY